MQLTRSRKIIGGLALAGTMALSGIVGFAQQGTTQGTQGGGKDHGSWGRGERGGHKKGGMRGMRGGGFGRFAENLNLTDAQKAQIEQITARYRETAKAGREQRQGRGERGFDAFGGGTFNEAEVRAAAQARANAQVEREVARARMMSELYNVLTAEQKAQLTAQRQQREQKRQERRTRRNADGATIPTSRT